MGTNMRRYTNTAASKCNNIKGAHNNAIPKARPQTKLEPFSSLHNAQISRIDIHQRATRKKKKKKKEDNFKHPTSSVKRPREKDRLKLPLLARGRATDKHSNRPDGTCELAIETIVGNEGEKRPKATAHVNCKSTASVAWPHAKQ